MIFLSRKKGTLRRRAQLALHLLKGHPVLYRVGVENARLYLQNRAEVAGCTLSNCYVVTLDKNGAPAPYQPFPPLRGWNYPPKFPHFH